MASQATEEPERIYLSRFFRSYNNHSCQFSYQRDRADDIEFVRVDPPAAPTEATSSGAWRQWFAQVGEAATVNVVNATATLVIAEREIVAAPPAPDEADKALALRVEAMIKEIRQRQTRGISFFSDDLIQLLRDLLAALAQARKEGAQAREEDYKYAVRLAKVLQRHYYADVEGWQPLETLNGVLRNFFQSWRA